MNGILQKNNGLFLVKAIILCWLLSQSSCRCKNENTSPSIIEGCIANTKILEEEKPIVKMIQEFEGLRRQSLREVGYEGMITVVAMDSLWTAILRREKDVLNVLWKYKGFEGSDLDGCLRNAWINDEVHALYLIAGIRQKSYFFNRDVEIPIAFSSKYRNDGLNFIYELKDSIEVGKLQLMDPVPERLKFTDFEKIWESYSFSRDNAVSIPVALEMKGLSWYKLSLSYPRYPKAKYWDIEGIKLKLNK